MSSVAERLAAALRRHDVDEIFAQSLPSSLLLAAADHGIRQTSYRTENAGGAMADGYARGSNRIGVVGAQNGPAATLLVPPLAEALKASVPVLALVQEVPSSNRKRNAFQEFDHAALFASCTKEVFELSDASRVDDVVDLAVTKATSGRPGPVVLLLPKDVLEEVAQSGEGGRTSNRGHFPADRYRPEDSSVRAAAELLRDAEAPIAIVGGGVHLSDATAAVARLQGDAHIPVATTTMGKGAVDERHPLSLGVVGYAMGKHGVARHVRPLVTEADVILLVGTRTNENGTDSWSLLPSEATYIHIDVDGQEVGRNYESVRLVGDARATLDDLTDAIIELGLEKRKQSAATVVEAIKQARSRHADDVAELRTCADLPVRPERVMTELDNAIDPKTILVADASYSTIWLANYVVARAVGQRFITPRGLAGLGWGLPLALGAKAANRDRAVVCVSGDGGFGHVWSEIETSVRADLPVTIVLFNNSILGYQKHAELYQFERHTSAVDFEPVDHSAIARACGANGIRIEDPSDLGSALKDALSSDKTTLIEVITDPNAYPPITSWDGHEDRIL